MQKVLAQQGQDSDEARPTGDHALPGRRRCNQGTSHSVQLITPAREQCPAESAEQIDSSANPTRFMPNSTRVNNPERVQARRAEPIIRGNKRLKLL